MANQRGLNAEKNSENKVNPKEKLGGFIHHASLTIQKISHIPLLASACVFMFSLPLTGVVAAFAKAPSLLSLPTPIAFGAVATFATTLITGAIAYNTTTRTKKYANNIDTKAITTIKPLAFAVGLGIPALIGGLTFQKEMNETDPSVLGTFLYAQEPSPSVKANTQTSWLCRTENDRHKLIKQFNAALRTETKPNLENIHCHVSTPHTPTNKL